MTNQRRASLCAAYVISFLSLAGCHDDSDPLIHDDVTVTTSVKGMVVAAVGGSRTLSITFNSSDTHPLSAFNIAGGLAALPPGWSGPGTFSCAAVGTGSGCVLNLTFAPTAGGAGWFDLSYTYKDNAGEFKTGLNRIAYSATSNNNVVASSAPSGQIDAIAGGGKQTVTITFTTDNGRTASGLALTTKLASLPAGWSSAANDFACATVDADNGCQLLLTYSPTAVVNDTVTLDYSYQDESGTDKTGSLNIPYAATSQNNVIATVSPAGPINTIVGSGSVSVPVTFTTDDGNPATTLTLTTDLATLPAGWSSTATTFTCGSVSSGNGCLLPLTYVPSVVGSGTLTLSYSYQNNARSAKTGSLDIHYGATSNNHVIGTVAPAGQVNAIVGSGTVPVTVTFVTDDSSPASALVLNTDLGSLPPGWSSTVTALACAQIATTANLCQLNLAFAPTAVMSGTLALSYSYNDDSGVAKTGSLNIPYASTNDNNVIATPTTSFVRVNTGASQSWKVTFTTDDGETATGLSVTSGLTSLPAGWSSSASTFICNAVSTGTACELSLTYAPTGDDKGTLTLGISYTNSAGRLKTGTVSVGYTAAAAFLYVNNYNNGTTSLCPINGDGSLGACSLAFSGSGTPQGIALLGNRAYIANPGTASVSVCTIGTDLTFSGCTTTGSGFSGPTSITINPTGTSAYVGNTDGTVGLCARAADTGALYGCHVITLAGGQFAGLAFSADPGYAFEFAFNGAFGTGFYSLGFNVNGEATSGFYQQLPTYPETQLLGYFNHYLYSRDGSGGLDVCLTALSVFPVPVAASCSLSGDSSVMASGIAFLGSHAYVSGPASGIEVCSVNSTDGSLSACAIHTDPTFAGTAGTIIR